MLGGRVRRIVSWDPLWDNPLTNMAPALLEQPA